MPSQVPQLQRICCLQPWLTHVGMFGSVYSYVLYASHMPTAADLILGPTPHEEIEAPYVDFLIERLS
jgi:hypothetical protein